MRHRLVKWWRNFLLRLASGGYKFSVRQSTSCPAKLFNSSALQLHQSIPDLRTIICYPSCFYFYYLILHFIPKPNSKLPFFKWLSPSLRTLLVTASLIFSPLGAVWPLVTSDAHNLLNCFLLKEHESSCTADLFSGFVRWKSFLMAIFNRSLWPSQASLDQSMLCKDERSKFKTTPLHCPAVRSEISQISHSSSSHLHPSPLLSPLCSCTVPMHILLLLLDNYYLLH